MNDRLFVPPASDVAKIEARLANIPRPLADLVRGAGTALDGGDLNTAQAVLARAIQMAPQQADVLRLYGMLLAQLGNLHAAAANFEMAIRLAPDDAMGYWSYAQVCEGAGDVASALHLRELAVQRIPDSPLAAADLGEHLARHQRPDAALTLLERATWLAPDYAPNHLKVGDALVACGRAAEGARAIRRALALEPAFGAAWLSLADVKTVAISAAEVAQMRALLDGGDIDEGERTAIGFALARACEAQGAYADAYALLVDANARRARELGGWDQARFELQNRMMPELFGNVAAPTDETRGQQAIFIVGMPRSGTTLVEQILASHPEVHGAGELGELAQVLGEESMRRQQKFPEWVPAATAADWQRLGQRYLDLTARHRGESARFTDKMPNNWQALGAIRAMLPGARVVICRRDPLETCWSCFKQYFPSGWEFTCDLGQLARFWAAFDRASTWWAARAPVHVREQGYEALTEAPEAEIRALLAFCGLEFDPACLAFHQTRRNVQTLSAAQVREPMRRHTGVAAAYGALLDPLRTALGLVAAPNTNGMH